MQHTQTLSLVTRLYNRLHDTILEVELHLVEEDMERVRGQLRPALESLCWGQEDLWEYIQQSRDLVRAVDGRVQRSKANVEAMQELMQSFYQAPFAGGRSQRNGGLLTVSLVDDSIHRQFAQITATGEKIQQLLQVAPNPKPAYSMVFRLQAIFQAVVLISEGPLSCRLIRNKKDHDSHSAKHF